MLCIKLSDAEAKAQHEAHQRAQLRHEVSHTPRNVSIHMYQMDEEYFFGIYTILSSGGKNYA